MVPKFQIRTPCIALFDWPDYLAQVLDQIPCSRSLLGRKKKPLRDVHAAEDVMHVVWVLLSAEK
jgi:hypothetical protein